MTPPVSIVDENWKKLYDNPEKFLSSLDTVESKWIECKASVFKEGLYDHLLLLNKDMVGSSIQEYPHEKRQASDKFLHDNLFHTLEAIAAMASQDGGGIVLLGAASDQKQGVSWNELFYRNPAKPTQLEASTLRQRYDSLAEGIQLGNVLIPGIDHEMPPERDTGAVDASVDKFLQTFIDRLFRPLNLNLSERQLWYCIGVYDFNPDTRDGKGRMTDREGRLFLRDQHEDLHWPIAMALPWRLAKWSQNFTKENLIADAICPTVQDKEQKRHFVALKIKGIEATNIGPLYYQTFPNRNHGLCTEKTKKIIPCALHEMEYEKGGTILLIRESCKVRREYYSCLEAIFHALALGRQMGNTVEEEFSQAVEQRLDIKPEDLFDTAQEDTINHLLKIYVPRHNTMERMNSFLEQQKRHCFFLTGDPGSGKSALAAYLVRKNWGKNRFIIYHFVNKSHKNRRDWRRITVALLFQTHRIVNLGDSFMSELARIQSGSLSEEEILEIQHNRLRRANNLLKEREAELIVVIDALDEMVAGSPPFFISKSPDFRRIKYIITSRVGWAQESLRKHLGRYQPEIFHLPNMKLDDVCKLCILNSINLTDDQVTSLLEQTNGNALYLYVILARIKADPSYDLSRLPSGVLDFFMEGMEGLLDEDQDGIQIQALALMLVVFRPVSIGEMQEIFNMTKKQVRDRILLPLQPYLQHAEDRGTMRYTFFHDLIASCLTHGEFPLVDEDDCIAAHEQIIAWCGDALDEPIGSTRREYAREYLPAHYWHLGKTDNFEGFLRLLQKDSLHAELACRAFIRNKVTAKSQEELLADRDFNDILTMLYQCGNKVARMTLYRFKNDLTGFGYGQWLEEFWENIFSKLIPGDPIYDELFTHSSSCGKKENRRLQIALNRLAEIEDDGSIINRQLRRSFLLTSGACLCIRNRSGKQYDPEQGITYLHECQNSLDNLTAADFLNKAHGDLQYANYLLFMTKGSYYNDMGYYHNQIGMIPQGLALYHQSGEFYRQALQYAPTSYLETRSRRGIYLHDANVGATVFWRSEFKQGLTLLMQALSARLQIGQKQSGVVNLNNIISLLHSLDLKLATPFLTLLVRAINRPGSRQINITRTCRSFDSWMILGDLEQAGNSLAKLTNLYEKNSSPLDMFFLCQRQLRYAVLQRDKKKCKELMDRCFSMLQSSSKPSFFDIHTKNFYGFWKNISLAYLVLEEPQKAMQVVQDRLHPWFEQEDFFFTYLYLRFFQLIAKIKRQLGETPDAQRLEQEAQQLLNAGRQQIAGMHFSPELMQHIDLLVEECDDEELTSLYKKIRETLATDLSALA